MLVVSAGADRRGAHRLLAGVHRRSTLVLRKCDYVAARPQHALIVWLWALVPLVKDVGDVPTGVDDTDNLDDAGTLPVEDKVLAVCKQP